jgi:orotidine-5'-phosphate decarboxylase
VAAAGSSADALAAAIDRAGSPACVGLDPVLESLPAAVRALHHEPVAAIAHFCRGVLRACSGAAAAVKFQSACFERYGAAGLRVLEEAAEEARSLGMFVLWDAKRGDIGTTCAHYAAAASRVHAHAITLSGYLGPSGITPFLDAGLGTFILVRTSNPDSDAIQSCRLADGRTIAELMADQVALLGAGRIGGRGMSDVGAVVGLTKSKDAAALRARMPHQFFLVPGLGAQGGQPEDVVAMLRPGKTLGERGVLVTASRSVTYPTLREGESWESGVARAMNDMARDVARAMR